MTPIRPAKTNGVALTKAIESMAAQSANNVDTFMLTNECGNAILTALTQAPRSCWQPIETAPKEEWVLVLIPGEPTGEMQVGKLRQIANGTSWVIGNRFAFDLEAPATHWQPLPEPPAASVEASHDG